MSKFMLLRSISTILLLFIFLTSCNQKKEGNQNHTTPKTKIVESIETTIDSVVEKEEAPFLLNEDNAIPFFFDYAKENKEDKVRITTQFGSFDIKLYNETPYHRANFIYLTKKGYFNKTYFHRVVKDFIIQGGNADNKATARKRSNIGRYLLPPDTRKGFKHHRGTISMPSSEINNPHSLASPFEFFIVVTRPGSYHLDGEYTAFGRVVRGMNVVDKINSVPIDDGEWPMENVIIQKIEIID